MILNHFKKAIFAPVLQKATGAITPAVPAALEAGLMSPRTGAGINKRELPPRSA